MINTKYNIGDKVCIEYEIFKITAYDVGIGYTLKRTDRPHDYIDSKDYLHYDEDMLRDIECIPVSRYEDEINDLKEEIVRLKNMYQLDHNKVLKLESEAHKDMPENIYTKVETERNKYDPFSIRNELRNHLRNRVTDRSNDD